MKNIIIFILIFLAIIISAGCQKNTPTAPAATATPPDIEGTVAAVLTNAAAANATATFAAQETASVVAGSHTPTITCTITKLPNQTETAAAIGTIVANIQGTETQAVILSRTATPTLTSTSMPTIDSSALIVVPGGTFTQVDDTGTNSFSHTISAFKIGKYQVDYDLWYTVYQWAISNGYSFQNAGVEGSGGTPGAAPTVAKYQPVTTVNWHDAIVWCNAYSEKSGLTLCYTYSAAVIRDSNNVTACDNAVCVWAASGYRLPTEGEYQYAASYKDGSSWTPYNYAAGASADYTDTSATGLVAWYSANAGGVTQNSGMKTGTSLDIYDMSGNVFEWCWDWYGAYPGTSTDYKGPTSGTARLLRGGPFNYMASYLQVGYRYSFGTPNNTGNVVGFRAAKSY